MTVVTDGRTSSPDRTLKAVTIAERVLSARAGSRVTLADPQDLGGSGRTDVVRVRVAQNPVSMDRSLVIKVLPADEPLDAFARELASYKYATALSRQSRPGPQLVAFDFDARVMVLSDLGSGRSMTDFLTSGDRDGTERAISAWGQALGRMHAATVGGEGDFTALLRQNRRSGTLDALRDQVGAATDLAPQVFAEYFTTSIPDSFHQVLREGYALFGGGEFRAFSPSDVGPENILINDDGVQFMDYEWGGFRDATLDVAYAEMTFAPHLHPSQAAARSSLETALVDAWRSEVQGIWPAFAHDGELRRRLLVARTTWAWLASVWLLPLEACSPSSMLITDGDSHGLSLYTTHARIVLTRWHDLAAAARRAGRDDLADCADLVATALDSAWLR